MSGGLVQLVAADDESTRATTVIKTGTAVITETTKGTKSFICRHTCEILMDMVLTSDIQFDHVNSVTLECHGQCVVKISGAGLKVINVLYANTLDCTLRLPIPKLLMAAMGFCTPALVIDVDGINKGAPKFVNEKKAIINHLSMFPPGIPDIIHGYCAEYTGTINTYANEIFLDRAGRAALQYSPQQYPITQFQENIFDEDAHGEYLLPFHSRPLNKLVFVCMCKGKMVDLVEKGKLLLNSHDHTVFTGHSAWRVDKMIQRDHIPSAPIYTITFGGENSRLNAHHLNNITLQLVLKPHDDPVTIHTIAEVHNEIVVESGVCSLRYRQ